MRPLLDVGPVRDIQRAYFELLRRLFGRPYDEMKKHGISPAQIAGSMSMKPSLVAWFADQSSQIVSTFADFWKAHQAVVDGYLRNVETMKSFFGGDISPIVDLGHFSSTLLYTDTVILQCPVLRLAPIISISEPQQALRLLVKHVLNVMRFEELAIAEVEPPILMMTGSAFALDEDYRDRLTEASEPYVVAHAQALLGRKFDDSYKLQEYLASVKDIPEAIEAIANPSRALFDTEWTGTLQEQLVRSSKELQEKVGMPEVFAQAGFNLFNTITGRMLQANELVLLSSSLKASPLISAPTSWQYLLWRYEYDAKIVQPDLDPKDLLITNAILTRGDREEVTLISGLSVEGIVALRKEGALSEMRALMRRGMARLDSASHSDLRLVSQEVSREIGEAFDKHDRELSELQVGKKRFYGLDVGASIVSGGLTLAGAATGNVTLAVLGSIATSLFGAQSIPAIRKTWQDLSKRQEEIKRSPAAILMKHKEN
jgi:hypothetical protein